MSAGCNVPFTPVDWAILGIVAISALISLKRGFVKEALSLTTWIIAGVVAWMFGAGLSQYLVNYIETPSARVIASCTILFVATLLVGAMVNFLIGELIRVTGLSGTDRFLGMVFGAARGGLLVVVAVGLLSLGPVQQDQWWQQSRLVPQFLMVADWSKNLILGMSSKWLASGISIPADLPFKEQILPSTPQQDVLGKSSSTK
ncbi:CvpA family protein [Pseudomonas tremae]|uniref:CvpA family protein n=1 Tax=Pseudomonas tremae TaxID=200454 RepID=A0AA40TVS4_9PSED|nr:CvpA family protein [Pseudomonas tremae]KPZ03674.1 CvpA family protein [Pseudomonas tremae]RMN90656.1 CvpA protein [Pseudomonas coronafaciens pv. coronafaciens]